MSELITYALDDGVAIITMDDGKVNALSSAMLAAVAGGLDRAEADAAAVVLTGRATTLSAGFDLRCPAEEWPQMLVDGAQVAERMLSFPYPIVVACNGNAVAMGAFLLLAGDLRIGVSGAFAIGLNEVAIGLTMPYFGLALARHRLTRPAFDRCTVTGRPARPAGGPRRRLPGPSRRAGGAPGRRRRGGTRAARPQPAGACGDEAARARGGDRRRARRDRSHPDGGPVGLVSA